MMELHFLMHQTPRRLYRLLRYTRLREHEFAGTTWLFYRGGALRLTFFRKERS